MTTLLDAARQALKALESYSKSPYIRHQHPVRFANGVKATTALRTAIEAAEKAEPAPKKPMQCQHLNNGVCGKAGPCHYPFCGD